MASFLITSIDSILMRIDQWILGFQSVQDECELKIGLRNLKVLLILRKSEPQLELKIEGSIARLLLLEVLSPQMVSEFHSLLKEVDCEFYNGMNMNQSNLLSVDEILGICQCNLESLADLLALFEAETYLKSTNAFEIRDVFEVHTRFLINFMHFGMQTSSVSVHNLLSHIQLIAIDATRMFIKDDDDCKWYKHVESKCFMADEKVPTCALPEM